MDWENERYVRKYVRETIDDVALSWQARAIWNEMLDRFDRAGIIELGHTGIRGLAGLLRMPAELIEEHLGELLNDGRVELRNSVEQGGCAVLVAPNYIEAQEAKQTDAQRQREYRARRRDKARAGELGYLGDPKSPTDYICNNGVQGLQARDADDDDCEAGDRPPARVPESPTDYICNENVTPSGDNRNKNVTTPPSDVTLSRTTPSRIERESLAEFPGERALPDHKRRVLSKHRGAVARIWAMANARRRAVNPKNRDLSPTAENLVRVAERLEAGYTERDCEKVVEAAEAKARRDKSTRWFNATTPWRPENFGRLLSWWDELCSKQQGQDPAIAELDRRRRERREQEQRT